MIQEILFNVREDWDNLGFDYPLSDEPNIILQSRKRIIIFIFDPTKADHPQVVVKLYRDKSESNRLSGYIQHVQDVRAEADILLKETIPYMKVFYLQDRIPGVIEKGLPGRPINVLFNIQESEFHAFAEWLLHFQKEVENKFGIISCGFIEALKKKLAVQYNIDPELLSLVDQILQPLKGLDANTACAVGDTHPSNILFNKGKISGVIDWEGTSFDKFLFYDWFQFELSVAQEYIKVKSPSINQTEQVNRAFELLFDPSNTKLGRFLDRQTDFYLNSAGLPSDLKLSLFILFLIDYYWIANKNIVVRNILSRTQENAFML